jgi:outer membrane lipoprotein-sorting protein
MESAAQILICDGETLWAYNPADSQVVIFAAATGENPFLTPHQLFFEFIDEYDVMNVEEEPFQGHDCWRLTMKPQDEADPTARLLVWVDKKDYLTRRLQIEDLAQNTMTFTFEDFATGQKLPDSTFQFAPPPSVEVIDMRP